MGKRLRDAHAGGEREVIQNRFAFGLTEVANTTTIAFMEGLLVLWGLLVASFLSATLLPGGSEVVLFGTLKTNPGLFWPALMAATIGNTLGGMTSYLIGRCIPQHRKLKGLERVREHGSVVLLLSWVPIVGDPMCVAAGLLRLNPWLSAASMATGKFARYLVVAFLAA